MLCKALIFLLVLGKITCSKNFGVISLKSDSAYCNDTKYEYIGLENISLVASNRSVFVVCPEKLNLASIITFDGITNLTFEGRIESKSEIRCSSNGGIKIVNSSNIHLRFLRLNGCSTSFGEKDIGLHQQLLLTEGAVLFENCVEVSVRHLELLNINGTGLTLVNMKGKVEVLNCLFEGSVQHMAVHSHGMSEPSDFNISNCFFLWSSSDSVSGGGLQVVLKSSQNVSVFISEVKFSSNSASKGGGMSITIETSPSAVIDVSDSEFCSNTAEEGGGVYISMSGKMASRSVSFTGCNFSNNDAATLGGGLKISSSRLSEDNSHIVFDRTAWTNNWAFHGSALCAIPETKNVSELRGFLPTLKFFDASFTSNKVCRTYLSPNTSIVEQYVEGKGAVYCMNFELHLAGSLYVSQNNGSAFQMEHNIVYFLENTSANFTENCGEHSGAIDLLSARMVVDSRVELMFSNNTANGIYGNMAVRYYTWSRLWSNFSDSCCFSKKKESSHDIRFDFTNNSVFVVSLEPCLRTNTNKSEVFKDVGHFIFSPMKEKGNIDTAAKNFNVTNIKEAVTNFVPGISKMSLNFESWTDLESKAIGRYIVRMENDADIYPFPGIVVNKSSISFYYSGDMDKESTVLLSPISVRKIIVSFRIKIVDCPAGFVNNNKTCVCITAQPHNDMGIICNESNHTATRPQGIWIDHSISSDNLEAGYCPPGYCSDNLTLSFTDNHVNAFNVCKEGREGRLCGKCKNGYSVFYHRANFGCGKNSCLCRLGWLFFLLSEVVPVTLTFVAIMGTGGALSSGPTNGLIFYAQVVLLLRLSGEEYFDLQQEIITLQDILSLFYGAFNLDFFVHEKLSFCLWEKVDYFVILWVNYLIRLYSLVLVGVTIAVLKYSHKLYSAAKSLGIRYPSINKSAIHGITAFLVLTYSKNVTLSLTLLRPGYIYNASRNYSTVVFYKGVSTYNEHQFTPLVVVACLSLFFVAVIPTLLLMFYPLHYKVLSLAGCSESKHVKKLISPLEKLKPLFDSFQSTFKDNLRFFSGLYFLYRFLIAMAFMLNTPSAFYIVMECILAIILITHSVFQPHKRNLHNIVDSLLFGNLLLINTLSISHLNSKHYLTRVSKFKVVSSGFQLVLVGIPFVVLVAVLARSLVHHIKSCRGQITNVGTPEDDEYLDSLVELESIRKISTDQLKSEYMLHHHDQKEK